jgi:hypothetical protein
LQSRPIYFNLRSYSLDLNCLLFQLSRQRINLLLLFLIFAVFFEKFIKQHRVHGIVADALDLSFPISDGQIRIDLRYVLGDQAVVQALSGVDLLLVVISDWFDAVKRFTC